MLSVKQQIGPLLAAAWAGAAGAFVCAVAASEPAHTKNAHAHSHAVDRRRPRPLARIKRVERSVYIPRLPHPLSKHSETSLSTLVGVDRCGDARTL